MSKQEFELYLSLLSRFLRLSPGQRSEIADELRDHLEERLDQLTADGLPRDEAVRRALDEFGDAAELATHFTELAQRRRRRFLMRCTLASIGAATAVVLIGFALWPGDPAGNMVPHVVAQQPVNDNAAGVTVEESAPAVAAAESDPQRAEIEAKLSKPLDAISFEDVPLKKALESIGEEVEVDILINETSLSEEGMALDEPVSLTLKHAKVSADAAITLVLDRAVGPGSLTWKIRDGLVYVQTKITSEEELELEVYNIRDLLEGVEPVTVTVVPGQRPFPGAGIVPGQQAGAGGGAGFFQVGDDITGSTPLRPTVGTPMIQGVPQKATKTGTVTIEIPAGKAIIEVIMGTTGGHWKDVDGTGGTIREFDGLLVVRQTQEAHREIGQLLEKMRESRQNGASSKKKAE